MLIAVFISSTEPRLRAAWRLILQVVLLILTFLSVSALAHAALQRVFSIQSGPFGGAGLLVDLVVELIAVTLAVYGARRFLDHRTFVSLGLVLRRRSFLDFLAGLGITFLMMGTIFLIEKSQGWLELTGLAWGMQSPGDVAVGVAVFLVVCLLVGWNEELISRGYHLQTIASGTSLVWGWFLSSAVFGALHLGNPYASWMAAAGIVLAGMFLGYAYVRTGQLWLSMGLHVGWNFFEGVVFGFPVSGFTFYNLLRISVSGPVAWTGGAFGPEAGLVLVPALAIGVLLIYFYTRSMGQRRR